MRSRTVAFGALFPQADADSVVTMRLLAAANDLRSAVRLMQGAIEDAEDGGHAVRSRAGGDMLYAFRMAAMHGFEAYRVLNEGKDVRDFFERRRGKRGDAFGDRYLNVLRRFGADDLQGMLKRVRNAAGAHYDREAFITGLGGSGPVEPSLIAFYDSSPKEEHFEAADELYWRVLAEELGTRFPNKPRLEAVGEAMRQIADVQIGVTELASLMLVVLYEERIDGA